MEASSTYLETASVAASHYTTRSVISSIKHVHERRVRVCNADARKADLTKAK